MEVIFFIYGLAFFLLGFAILYYPRKDSAFLLARKVHFIGWFGIAHGINEWLDLFMLVYAGDRAIPLKYAHMVILPLSFWFLVYFGADMIAIRNPRLRAIRVCTLALPLVLVVVFLCGRHNELRWDIWSRYLLGFTGAVLTGTALLLYLPEIQSPNPPGYRRNLQAAGLVFLAYAGLAGLIVPDAGFFPASVLNYSLVKAHLGIPVQVFRACCAVAIAYHVIRSLSLFHWEMRQSLFQSEFRLRTVIYSAPVILFVEDMDLRMVFLAGKGLESIQVDSARTIGRPVAEVFGECPSVAECSRRALQGEAFTTILFIHNSYFDTFFGPHRDDRGDIRGVIGFAVDVTRQQKAQAEAEAYRNQMEQNKVLAALGAASSEIVSDAIPHLYRSKTLFSRVLSDLGDLPLEDSIRPAIHDGLSNLSEVLQKFEATYSKLGIHVPQEQPIDIHGMVQGILSVFQESAQRAGLRITTAGTRILPSLAMPPRELEQVFFILIQCAIRACEGQPQSALHIQCDLRWDRLCLTFSDTCPRPLADGMDSISGIQPVLSRGFSDGNFEIAVLKGIVSLHGGTLQGTITAKGARFEVALPLNPAR
jgi:signal transduction histidine kinase